MKSLQALSLLLAAAHSEAAFSWNNVRLGGGGGFVSGIVFHPKTQGVAYARTDIGGLYKLNSDDSWRAVTDDITQDGTWHNWGIDALALDPQNAQVVYAALGMYTNFFENDNGAIAKSTDQGNTWSFSNLPFKVGGNMPGRGTGERLAVDPANSNIIYFGARSGHGLWKSSDGGVTFSNVASFTNTGTFRQNPSDSSGYQSDLMGLLFVTFDSTSPTVNGATSRIFVGVADNVTASIYVSTDAGSTWSPLAGQPRTFFPHKCKLQPIQKSLYLTYSNGMGPYDGSDGAVWRYDLTGGSWTNITPDIGQKLYFGFGGLGIDMLKPGYLVVASLNSWWPNAQLFRSNNSGVSWTPIWEWHWYPNTTDHFSISSPNAPWIKNSYWDNGEDKDLGWMIEALEIDPFDSNHWLYGTGMTVMGGHDLTSWDSSHHVSITTLADGIEETSIQSLVSAPGGSELLAAVGDISGFTFSSPSSLATAPAYNWMNPKFATSTDVDYAGQNVAKAVRSGNGKGTQQIGISNDGGITWSTHSGASTTAYGGSVAYSASGDTILWSTANEGVLRSQNINTFTSVSSLPSNALIASDKQNSNYFYAGSSSNFYISSDNGQSFFSGGSLSGASRINYIAAHPTTAGQVYVSTNAGIYMSTNFGRSFTALTTALTNVSQIALGVGPGSTWYLYAFGAGYNGNKLYGSADNGNSWTDLQGARGFGQITQCKLTGSGNVAGQVYVGTNGRGIFVAQGSIIASTITNDTPTSTPPSTSPTSTATTTTTMTSTSSSTTSISTPTETPSPYIIFPIQDVSQSQVTTFQTELEQTIGAFNVAIYESADGSWVFWTAKLNSTQVSAVVANPAVGP
ncbi:hypothetical protein B0O99DRAFT_513709 [Bisporella sp. PMI_857]|nr:hypothetical protein B0O99DRAFT_513709 [Bisporella sp. PMI_857]